MNLLKETIQTLEANNKTIEDVLWITDKDSKITWNEFEKVANFEYDDGYGGQEINSNLIILGKNFWLERHEYDGSEWWEFKKLPKSPSKKGEVMIRNKHWYDD